MTDWLRTEIGATTADSITIRGRDLAGELMGRVTFTELAFLLVQGRMPAAGETTLLDAVLVSLADHGLTPTVLAARLTYTGAPESLQGSVAAGLLGAGSVFLGVVEDAAVFLAGIIAAAASETDADLRAAAGKAVAARLAAGRRIPGLGHPIHKVEDPRTPRMYAIAAEAGVLGPNLRALRDGGSRCGRPSGQAASDQRRRRRGRGPGRPWVRPCDRARVRPARPHRRGRRPPGRGDVSSRSACRSSASSTARLAGEDA